MHTRAAIITLTALLAAGAAFQATFANAESVLWGTTETADICYVDSTDAPRCGAPGISDPNIQIQYHAQAVNADTGATIPCASSVPAGTSVRFEFLPHTYQDIYWFGIGKAYDSPYGDWVADGGKPPVDNLCIEKNYASSIFVDYENYWVDIYSSLAVNPPEKSLTVAGGACTKASDGLSAVCTSDTPGVLDASFAFGPTFGHFWINTILQTAPKSCPVPNAPGARVSQGALYPISGHRLVTVAILLGPWLLCLLGRTTADCSLRRTIACKNSKARPLSSN